MVSDTPQIAEAIKNSQHFALLPDVIAAQGSGKAYQCVAQSMAIAVQDATDGLRNTTTIATTAMGVAFAQFFATGNGDYLKAIKSAQEMVTSSAATLKTIGDNAKGILGDFTPPASASSQ